MKINRNILKFISLMQLGIVIVFCCIYLGSKDKREIIYYENNDAWKSAFQTYDSYDIDSILKECENRIAEAEEIEYDRDEWDSVDKARFYNDYENGICVSEKSNREKGASGPSEWLLGFN